MPISTTSQSYNDEHDVAELLINWTMAVLIVVQS